MGVQGQSPFIMVITLTKLFVKVFLSPPTEDTENDL